MSEQVASKESATAEPNAPQPGRGKVQAIANAIEPRPKSIACPPESVNWYLTPICNYRCGFCFFTVKGYEELKPLSTGMFMQPDLARTLLARLRDSGTKKVTFVGGEPTLVPALPTLVRWTYELGMTPMIVSNGTGLTDALLDKLVLYLTDPIRPGAIKLSLDSGREDVEQNLGRGRGDHLARLKKRARAIHARRIPLMVNIVVTSKTWREDMHNILRELQPIARLKILQVLPIDGQNDHAWESLKVTAEQFRSFCERHSNLGVVVEDNDTMTESYAMVDPLGRFFQNTGRKYHYSRPILDVGVIPALSDVGWDREKFVGRGGRYHVESQNQLGGQLPRLEIVRPLRKEVDP